MGSEGEETRWVRPIRSSPVTLVEDRLQTSCQVVSLGRQIDLVRVVIRGAPPSGAPPGTLTPVVRYEGVPTQPRLGIQYIRRGAVAVDDRDCGRLVAARAGDFVFRHVSRVNLDLMVDLSRDFELVALTVPVPALHDLLGSEGAARLLFRLQVPRFGMIGISPVDQKLALTYLDIDTPGLQGPVGILRAQALALEFLCGLTGPVEDDQDSDEAGRAVPRTLLNQIRDDLEQSSGSPPLLSDLAEKYVVPARQLNDGFRREFGLTIYAYLNDHRLTQARRALLETDVPLKALAAELGYSHVNHFITAFRQKFGQPPGTLRKKA